MCNLYRMTKSKAEVAEWFGAEDDLGGANFGAEVYPGYPGLVIAEGAVRQMHWGFPLALKGKGGQKLKPKPVNNTRSDKLDSFFWRDSFVRRRCLVPLTAWAEAEGAKGSKTRTWLSRPGSELFAAAGIWRSSDEWGDCYSIVLTGSAGRAADVHTRMPVLLAQEDYAEYLHGDPASARDLCIPWSDDIILDRTDQPWSGGSAQRSLI
ncbi:MAG TPA: hypothetical protein DCS24_06370 [Erythrobacter sp.]|nr:hypothetical protein [Erythrobacter sp.]